MVELGLRLIFSLAVVIGLLLLIVKFGARRMRGSAGSLVRVVVRQPLSRTSSISVVDVGGRMLVLGTTEHEVRLLTELDPDDVATAEEPTVIAAVPSLQPTGGALAGSMLSAQTWKQALAAATGRSKEVS